MKLAKGEKIKISGIFFWDNIIDMDYPIDMEMDSVIPIC